MGITRIATSKDSKKMAFLIEVDGKKIELSRNDLLAHDTAEKIKTEITSRASLSSAVLPPIFFHVNKDGTLAVATGKEPAIWPEDEVEDKQLSPAREVK